MQNPAYKFVRPWLWLLLPAILGVVADMWLKYYAFPNGVPPAPPYGIHYFDPPTTLIPGILGFQTTVNRGAVFGIGQGKVMFFLAFSVVALGLILYLFATTDRKQWVTHLSLGMILSGALGNMYDRAVYAGVRDMLKFTCFKFGDKDYYPYIFNIADILLCVGVPLLMLCWLLAPKHKPAKV